MALYMYMALYIHVYGIVQSNLHVMIIVVGFLKLRGVLSINVRRGAMPIGITYWYEAVRPLIRSRPPLAIGPTPPPDAPRHACEHLNSHLRE